MWRVANPYTTNLPLTDLTYSLASGGSTFIDGKVTPTGSIPARGKKIIQIPATVPFRSLMAALKSIKPGAVVPYAAQFKTGVNVCLPPIHMALMKQLAIRLGCQKASTKSLVMMVNFQILIG